ncbi:MAG: hypothetical protein KGL15_05930 [Acidobacteriota bacterium]|nr:hypothetical protein [Acidobacteriota bacterium]
MSTRSQQPAHLTRSPGSSTLALLIELDPLDTSAMLRVLTLLARRRCGVLRATFAPDPDQGCDLLELELDAPRRLERNVMAWLSALMPVRAVAEANRRAGCP